MMEFEGADSTSHVVMKYPPVTSFRTQVGVDAPTGVEVARGLFSACSAFAQAQRAAELVAFSLNQGPRPSVYKVVPVKPAPHARS